MKVIYINLSDNDDSYGIIKVYNETYERIDKLLADYKDNDEEYNVDGFVDWLAQHNIKAEVLEVEEMYF